jgi:hypothetical protein
MTHLRLSVGVVGVVAVIVASSGAFPATALAQSQSDPHIGTWVLDVNRSKYTPGPPPRAQTSIYSVEGSVWKVATKGTGMLGQPTSTEFTMSFDGKDHPVRGNADWDAIAVKRVDSHTIEFTRKKGGKAVQSATSVVSKDGKTRTVTSTGVNARGDKVNSVAVYNRK